jgi:hypothetical protein
MDGAVACECATHGYIVVGSGERRYEGIERARGMDARKGKENKCAHMVEKLSSIDPPSRAGSRQGDDGDGLFGEMDGGWVR